MWGFLVFVNLFALVVAAGVAGAVLPRKARNRSNDFPDTTASPRQKFPWFWVVFPLTCFSAATALSISLDPPLSLAGPRRYADYLEPDIFTIANALSTVFFLATVFGVALSIWAWKSRRI